MGFATSHAPSLSRLGYPVQAFPDPEAPLTVIAGQGAHPLIPFEVITPHKKLGPRFASWIRGSFGWTVERRTPGHWTMFYRAYRPNSPLKPFRMDMIDHWGRIHSFVVRGPGEYAVAYSGTEEYVPPTIELANTEPKSLTPINSNAIEVAADYFLVMACQFGLKRLLSPKDKSL